MAILKKTLPAALAVAMAFRLAAAATSSDAAFVFLRTDTSSFWRTAPSSTVTLPVDYPPGATVATLDISGVRFSRHIELAPGTNEVTVAFPAPVSPESENVYDLTLSFDAGAAKTARIGVVSGCGASSGSTRYVVPATSRKWSVVKGRAVMAIPYGMESFTLDGATIPTGLGGAQGWYALALAGGGSATVSDGSVSRTLEGVNSGLAVTVR